MPSLHDLLEELSDFWTDPSAGAHFRAALTRRAYNAEAGKPDAPHHESLEWLGDRILGAIVAQELWRRFPHAPEGRLDLARDALTSAAPLASIGRTLGVPDALRAGRGERLQEQTSSDKTLSAHLEALIGASWLAGGWPGATALVHRLLDGIWPATLPDDDARSKAGDPLTMLSQAVQSRWRCSLPRRAWTVDPVGGPNHRPWHRATVRLPDDSQHVGDPVGGKQRLAKESAALRALAHIERLRERRDGLTGSPHAPHEGS